MADDVSDAVAAQGAALVVLFAALAKLAPAEAALAISRLRSHLPQVQPGMQAELQRLTGEWQRLLEAEVGEASQRLERALEGSGRPPG